jgi:beta-mannosidase
VGESEWMFKTTINMTEEELAAEHVDLVFDGLDTFAIIKLVSLTTRKAISS